MNLNGLTPPCPEVDFNGMAPEEITKYAQDREIQLSTLWVWKSKKGYWNSEREKWVTHKSEATPLPWRRAFLCVTIGEGKWERFED